jgi:hypothetical protein
MRKACGHGNLRERELQTAPLGSCNECRRGKPDELVLPAMKRSPEGDIASAPEPPPPPGSSAEYRSFEPVGSSLATNISPVAFRAAGVMGKSTEVVLPER